MQGHGFGIAANYLFEFGNFDLAALGIDLKSEVGDFRYHALGHTQNFCNLAGGLDLYGVFGQGLLNFATDDGFRLFAGRCTG